MAGHLQVVVLERPDIDLLAVCGDDNLDGI
jgi:hypothetical protein